MASSSATQILVVVYIFLVAVLVTVGARTYTRVHLIRSFGIDDWIMLFCVANYVVQTVLLTMGVHYGIGRHVNSGLTRYQIIQATKYMALWEYLYIVETAVIKLSVGCSLLRLSCATRWPHIIYTAFFFDIVAMLIILIRLVTRCAPASYMWNGIDPTSRGSCGPQKVVSQVGYALSGTTIILDLLFVIIPICMLWKLQMKLQMKILIMLLLGLGIFACTANFIRLRYLVNLSSPEDQLYKISEIIIWSTVECGAGMVGSSLATVRPLLKPLCPPKFTEFQDSETLGHAGGNKSNDPSPSSVASTHIEDQLRTHNGQYENDCRITSAPIPGDYSSMGNENNSDSKNITQKQDFSVGKDGDQ